MPDEISHLLLTYLALKHPRLKSLEGPSSRWDVAATYFFTLLPDLGNALMAVLLAAFMASHSLPVVMGPRAMENEAVWQAFNDLRVVYYVFHSYVTYFALIAVLHVLLRRIYWPLAIGMGLAITSDIPTHRGWTALKPFYPLLDVKIDGIVEWGSWIFYIAEVLFVLAYTVWLYRRGCSADNCCE